MRPCDPGRTLEVYGGPLMSAPAVNGRSPNCSSVITLKQTMDKVVQSFRMVNCLWYVNRGTNFAFRYQVVVGVRALGGSLGSGSLGGGGMPCLNNDRCNNGIRRAAE